MKRILTALCLVGLLTACSSSTQNPSDGIYDMKAVQDYRERITTGNTVSAKQKAAVADRLAPEMKLNASDNRPKQDNRSPISTPMIVPSIGLGYGYHHHHW